jgi:hypothetical protein
MTEQLFEYKGRWMTLSQLDAWKELEKLEKQIELEEEELEKKKERTCQICGLETKSAHHLNTHMSVHDKKENVISDLLK